MSPEAPQAFSMQGVCKSFRYFKLGRLDVSLSQGQIRSCALGKLWTSPATTTALRFSNWSSVVHRPLSWDALRLCC